MSLMNDIRQFQVPKRSVGIWWLGQNGYIFKSPEGVVAAVDLYLTNSCHGTADINLDRLVPILINPEELVVDVFACTHNHQDHTDPFTIRALRHKDTMQFIGPHPSCNVFRQEGVEQGRVVPSWPDCEIEFRDIRMHGTFAMPTDATDLNHMGFVFRFGDGPTVYVTGDTDYSELLFSAARHQPDLLITCINGGFNNLSHWEAAGLASNIKPKAAIPCHYDMFPDNSANPKLFEAALKLKAPDVRYQELAHGQPLLFSK